MAVSPDPGRRIEDALQRALRAARGSGVPPRLAEAMRCAVFPGGQRARPRLCLAVAQACGEDAPELSDSAAVAVELLHCAALAHDGLTWSDDARVAAEPAGLDGRFGVPLAVLAGDALIVLAFQSIASGAAAHPGRLARLVRIVNRAVGMPDAALGNGIGEVNGIDLPGMCRHGKGRLFAAAAAAGAIAAGACEEAWAVVGERLGFAWQYIGTHADAETVPVSGPAAPAGEAGQAWSAPRLEWLLARTIAAIPACRDPAIVAAEIRGCVGARLPRRTMPHPA